MTAWQDLSSAALLGTARRPLRAWPVGGVAGRADASAETQLLDAAALLQAERRAGLVPEGGLELVVSTRFARSTSVEGREPSINVDDEFAPAPPDTLAEPGPLATQLLELVLFQNPAGACLRIPLLRVWAEAALATGHHVPAHLLSTVLNLPRADDPQWPALMARVVDERGRWLTSLRPARADVSDATRTDMPPSPSEWPATPTPRRVAWLTRLRSQGHVPEAHTLLQSTWTSEPARDRADLIASLGTALSMADEPFLEDALGDKAASVRDQTATLLGRLPESRFAARMAARLEPLVHRTGLVHKTITVDAPDDPDALGIRDGLTTPSSGSQRDFWLTRMIATTPLSFWARFGSPARVLSEIGDEVVTRAIGMAIDTQADREWATAFIDQHGPRGTLLRLVPPAQQLRWADRLLHENGRAWLPIFVDTLPRPWDAPTSRVLVEAVIAHEQSHLADTPDFALALHPSVLPDLSARIPQLTHRPLATALSHVATYHSVRHSILEAFR